MTARHVDSTRLLALALLAASGACDLNPLRSPAHGDAATKPQDGSPNVVAAPASQPVTGGQCPDGYTPCGKGDGLRCHDLSRSPDHCGACGKVCASGIACQAGTCQQYRCKGALSFKTKVFGPVGVITALGDFDGDGSLDLVGATDQNLGTPLRLFYGAGDGTFLPDAVIVQADDQTLPDAGWPMPIMTVSWQAIAADLDGDGHLDLTTIRGASADFKVRLGSGSRTSPFGQPTSYSTNEGTDGMVLADFETDGQPDLVVSANQGFEYWHGQGSGRFERQVVLDTRGTYTYGPGRALATDWNGDGVLDLVYGMGSISGSIVLGGGQLHYRLGRGDGRFDAEVACALTAGIVGDLDHDQRPDLISSSSTMGSSLLLGIEGCQASKLVAITDWTKQGGVALADFNGDGHNDVILDSNQAIVVHIGDGKGGFPHTLTLSAPTAGQWPMGSFLVGDLNRDSKLDVVFAREGGWGVLLNTCQ